MVCLASISRLAMVRRMESSGTSSYGVSVYSALTCAALAPVASAGAAGAARSTSLATTRPCGPEPVTRDKSMPRSEAKRRASGVVNAPPGSFAGTKLRSGVRTSRKGSSGVVRGVGAACIAATGAAAARGGRAFAGAAAGEALGEVPAPEITATTAPTLATSPTPNLISLSVPALVAGTSIEVLSVSISNRLSPGFTASPADLNHFTILPSATVSPSCGIRTSTLVPCSARRVLPRHRHILRLEKFFHAFRRAFAAKAGLLGAAERRRRIGDDTPVQADHAEVELLGHAQAAAEVFRVEIGDQTVFSVVGALDRLVLGLEALNRSDGPENFIVQHLGIVGDIGEHGGGIEETGADWRLAAGQHLGALLDCIGDQLDHLVAAFFVNQRSEIDAVVEAVAHLQRLHLVGEFFRKLVVHL